MNRYQGRVTDVLRNTEKYHRAYYRTEVFGGPSLYFHQRALRTRKPPSVVTHLEYVYATLSSWGMHRMGKGGSKMQAFDTFRQSVESLKERIVEGQRLTPQSMSPRGWEVLSDIFRGLKVMASGTRLVGNSKAMHHMMPDVVPPIDREYTLRYLHRNTTIRNDVDLEWRTMKSIISDFFIPIACDAEFASKARDWMANQRKFPWDTSTMKVIDNLVIGSRK